MEKDLVNIIVEKNYIELSANEKAELSELCGSEAEYNQIREVFLEVEMMQFEKETPKKETKVSLDSLFDATYPKVTPVWYLSAAAVIMPKEKPVHRQPLLQIAAVGLLFFLAYPFFQTEVNSDLKQVAVVDKIETSKEIPTIKAEPVDVKTVDEDVQEVYTEVSTPRLISAAIDVPGSNLDLNHSDGVFDTSTEIAFSQPASAEPEMLDLLTATF